MASCITVEDAVRQNLASSNKVNIVVVGLYHVGKSTLINSIFDGEGGAKEGDSMEVCTIKVEGYEIKPKDMDVTVTIYDTPGLQDGKNSDRKYLRQIRKECPVIHLVIYCTHLKGVVRPEEIQALENIATIFGEEILDNVVIALTCANLVSSPYEVDSEQQYFESIVDTKKTALESAFSKLKGKHQKYFENFRERTFAVGSLRKPVLPTGKSWRDEFWKGSLATCKEEAEGAVFKLALKYRVFEYYFESMLYSIMSQKSKKGVRATGKMESKGKNKSTKK